MKALCHAVIAVGLSVAALGPGEPASPQAVGASGPTVATGESRRFLVRFEETLSNPTDAPLRDVVCAVVLPYDATRQRVRWMRWSAHDWTVAVDAHGQRIATARLEELAPGDAVTFAWIASVDLSRSRHVAVPGGGRQAPHDVRRLYLSDDPVLRLGSDEVRAAAEIVRRRADGSSPVALARAAFEFVRSRVRYERVGGWDDAATVLGRGSGSCSEATYAYVAVCRALGIPARWTGGTVLRRDPPGRPVDEVFHRVAEVHLPGHGWLPVDPSIPPEQDDGGAWGGIHRGFLLLARGDSHAASGDPSDSASSAPLGDSYTARCRWTQEPGTPRTRQAQARRRFFWLDGAPDDWARLGPLHGLARDHAPSYPRAELILADAQGFGPAITRTGSPAFPGAAPVCVAPLQATRLLFEGGHPGALQAAHAGRLRALRGTGRSPIDGR